MGYMVEITENKFDELVDNCEEMVRAGGKVMKCLDSLKRERMGNRMPMPDYRDKFLLIYLHQPQKNSATS